MLRKTAIETVVPPVQGVEGSAESTYCTAPPPDEEDGGGPIPPGGAEGDDGDSDGSNIQQIYLYVPNDPNNAAAGEVRTPALAPAPAGYTCGLHTHTVHIDEGVDTPVREIRCTWNYP